MRYDKDEDTVISYKEFEQAIKPIETKINRKKYHKYITPTKSFLQKIERHHPEENYEELVRRNRNTEEFYNLKSYKPPTKYKFSKSSHSFYK